MSGLKLLSDSCLKIEIIVTLKLQYKQINGKEVIVMF